MSVRVALVTYAMNCGGMETFLLRLGCFLQRAGHVVEVITTQERGAWFARAAQLGLGASHYGPEDPEEAVSALVLAFRIGRRLARGAYDIVFVNHARYAQAALGLLPERMAAVPILHNTFDGIFTVGCANQRNCNVIVAVGPRVAELARPRMSVASLVTIPYGVESPTDAAMRGRRAFELPLRILFVGRLENRQKGVLLLPDILKGCLDRGLRCVLEIVGDGPDRQRLEERLVEMKVDSHCRLSGRIDDPKVVYERFLDSHVLLFPSFFEGLPIVPLEAQACGCVPVASRLRGVTDHAIEDGHTGILVPPADIDAFVQGVTALHDNPSEWAATSQRAHVIAKTRFSVDAMGRGYLDLIANLREGRYARRRGRRFVPLDPSLFTWRESLGARLSDQ
jgi:glycosyltransferase involved in cell wall biosynthesis